MTIHQVPRGLLWVDRVGGYLVLLSDQVSIGQATPENDVDIPILADVSRRHAKLRRVQDMYLIQPLAPTSVNGFRVSEPTPLADGDVIGLGERVRLRFRQPTPLSDTARLEFLSGHRAQPSCDGVLLFGETCILGSAAGYHVPCPTWDQHLILSRQGDSGFRFRADHRVEIDGVPQADSGILPWNANLTSSCFALRFERL